MRRLLALVLLGVASTVAAGCNDSTSPFHPTSAALAGTWQRLAEVPGSSEQWNLIVAGTVVTGGGTWSGEACCSGTLTITGYTSGDSLHVDVTMTTTIGTRDPAHEHFDGALQDPSHLVGHYTLLSGVAQFTKTT